MQDVVWICCGLWSESRNFCVRMIFDVVGNGISDDNCDGDVKCFLWLWPLYLLCDLEQPIWESWWLWLLYLHDWDCDLNLLCLYLSLWCHLEVDLVQCLVLKFGLWQHVGVPDGGILSGLSTIIWPYSLHSKQYTFGQWHAMWPNSWLWKHWSSSLDITLTLDEGNKVAVSCCAVWSFSTLLMVSSRDWGPFS